MNPLTRLHYSLHRYGLGPTLGKTLAVAADCLFDIRHGVDTRAWAQLEDLTIRGANRDRGARYQPTHVRPLRRMLEALRPQFTPGGVFVDLGCGKGRALLIASEFGFREVRGVEFAHELCTIAEANCAAFKRKQGLATEFRILEEDVVRHHVAGDESVFFLFNPFDAEVMHQVLDNMAASLAAWPRRILIIYHNPKHAPVIAQHPPFAAWGQFDFGASTFAVYANPP